MSLHRLTGITLAVPDLAEAARFYRDFGLREVSSYRFASRDGGDQLELVEAPARSLVKIGFGVDDPDDLGRIAARLESLELSVKRDQEWLRVVDPATQLQVEVSVAERIQQDEDPAVPRNVPGRHERLGARATKLLPQGKVEPRRLGHVVVGSTDPDSTRRLFLEGIGLKLSDYFSSMNAHFMRCTSDHHNLLVQHAPVNFMHHTAWEVDNVDEIGRGATQVLSEDPSRHAWGLGRHCVGSNYFWYLKDPAGNFTEYYCDMDSIEHDDMWTPEDWSGRDMLFTWGPEPPAWFVAPDDVVERVKAAAAAAQ